MGQTASIVHLLEQTMAQMEEQQPQLHPLYLTQSKLDLNKLENLEKVVGSIETKLKRMKEKTFATGYKNWVAKLGGPKRGKSQVSKRRKKRRSIKPDETPSINEPRLLMKSKTQRGKGSSAASMVPSDPPTNQVYINDQPSGATKYGFSPIAKQQPKFDYQKSPYFDTNEEDDQLALDRDFLDQLKLEMSNLDIDVEDNQHSEQMSEIKPFDVDYSVSNEMDHDKNSAPISKQEKAVMFKEEKKLKPVGKWQPTAGRRK